MSLCGSTSHGCGVGNVREQGVMAGGDERAELIGAALGGWGV